MGYTDGDVEHLTADQVREFGDEAQSWSGVLNKAEHAECKAGFAHDAPRVSVPYCRFGGSCWRPLSPYVHASSRTRARKWAELWAWIAANEGETDLMGAVSQSKDHDAKHDKTMPSLLYQSDGVESKLRDEMSARFDRDHRENDRDCRDDRDRRENDRDRQDSDKNRSHDRDCLDDRDRRENDRDRQDSDKNRRDDRDCCDDRDRRENDRDRQDSDKNRRDERDCRDDKDRHENDRDRLNNDKNRRGNDKNSCDDRDGRRSAWPRLS